MPAALPLLLLLIGPADDKPKEQGERELKFGIDVAKRGLWKEARFRFERAVALDPDSPQALNNLAVALEQQGEFEGARAAYEKALEAQAGQPLHPAELRPLPGSR